MITKAAVLISDKKQNKNVIIPCHRHCDVLIILKRLGYSYKDFTIIKQGFLDEHGNFLNRVEAYAHAVEHHQITPPKDAENCILYSEDLY